MRLIKMFRDLVGGLLAFELFIWLLTTAEPGMDGFMVVAVFFTFILFLLMLFVAEVA